MATYSSDRFISALFGSTQYVANTYLQEYLTLTYVSNTYATSTYASNNYIDGRFASNNYLISTFTSNNYVDNQLNTRIGIRATNTYVQSTFTSNTFVVDTFSSNAYMRDHVATEVAGIVNSAPATLDTLNELAAALGDDPSFATSVTNTLATKAANTFVVDNFVANGNIITTYTSNSHVSLSGNVSASSYYGDGSKLTGISAGATGGGDDRIFYENQRTVTTDYTIGSSNNAMSAGPITINSGVTITIPSGAEWSIV